MANIPPRQGSSPYNAPIYDSAPVYNEDPYASPPPPPAHRQYAPPARGIHPQSNFQHMQEERQYGVSSQESNYHDAREGSISPSFQRRPVGAAPSRSPVDRNMSPSPPMHPGMPAIPPPASARSQFQDARSNHSVTPPQQDPYHNHNYGPAAGGAALGAGAGSGAAALIQSRSPPPAGPYGHLNGYSDPSDPGFEGGGSPYRTGAMHSHDSYSSDAPLSAAAVPPALGTPTHSDSLSQYHDYAPSPARLANPYTEAQVPSSRSYEQMTNMAFVDPNDIIDDGDDFIMQPKRASRVNLPFNKSKGSINAMPAVGAGAIGDDVAGYVRDPSGNYGPIPAKHAGAGLEAEKSSWIQNNGKRNTKWKKIIFIVGGLLIVVGIVVGAVVGILSKNKQDRAISGANSAAADDASGDLSKDSAEIKKLMNNPNLHKVFSGFAYTPFAAQYPECLTNPPSQNNVTRDMAMLGQLTNVVRLYGTDCNQTEMVLHAIDRLQLTDMKIWLGVWLGNNQTTNTRQVSQMWKILDNPSYSTKYIKGVVVGNEVLFRKDLTETQLGTYLSQTKTNLTSRGMDLPVATSDLGDNWTANLATEVDVIMSNVHPFFGGVVIDQAAAWTWDFWQNHDVAVTKGMTGKQHIISEFGWPSAGGNDCGTAAGCPDSTSGAVAGIANMNTLMDTWVCQALKNGTDYFWFEAFDEPWKIQYNTANQNWEDKWGLMDINRNLKKGLQIPTCNGNTTGVA